jgi:hypothetical protein
MTRSSTVMVHRLCPGGAATAGTRRWPQFHAPKSAWKGPIQSAKAPGSYLPYPKFPPRLSLPPNPALPELNPVEDLRRFMRGNGLPNRVFASSDDIIDHCRAPLEQARRAILDDMSTGPREGAHGFRSPGSAGPLHLAGSAGIS